MQCEFIQNEHLAKFAALAAQCDADVVVEYNALSSNDYQSFEIWDPARHLFSYPQDAIGAPLGSA